MTARSMKAPGSPSSALQTMYFCSADCFWAIFHLVPVLNPPPPRPRRPESSTISQSSAGVRPRSAFERPGVTATREVLVEAGRIDDAAVGQDPAGLRREEGVLIDERDVVPRRHVRIAELTERSNREPVAGEHGVEQTCRPASRRYEGSSRVCDPEAGRPRAALRRRGRCSRLRESRRAGAREDRHSDEWPPSFFAAPAPSPHVPVPMKMIGRAGRSRRSVMFRSRIFVAQVALS